MLNHIVPQAATFCYLLMVLSASVRPAFAVLVREPYLQLATPTSIRIVWRTGLNSPDDSRVQYGTNVANLNQTATGAAVIPGSNTNVKDHFVTITGLSPATQYFYNIGTTSGGVEGGGTAEHYFVTAPPVGSAAPFTAWVLGDSGNGTPGQASVRDTMLTATGGTPPNIILHAGDIAYEDGTDSEFTSNHFGVYEDILRHTVLWPTLGNHEARSVNTSLGTGPYYEAHVLPTAGEAGGEPSGTEAYYSFDYANVHFIVLDSMDSNRAPGSAMLTWLQADLAATTQQWLIACWHHPPYSKGTHNSDSATDSGGRLVDMRENVLPILEAGGVDLVIAGHSHGYERSYLIGGAYGYGSGPNFATPDFSTLEANGNILDSGDGDPSGNGAYQKNPGGAVYVVAGHGGKPAGGTGGHPVMFFFEAALGSLLLDIDGSTLTVSNLRVDNVITDFFSMELTPNGMIDTPIGPQTINVGDSVNFTGTGTDPDNQLPLTYLWDFGDPAIADSTVEDPGVVIFPNAGDFTTTYTVTNALGVADATPATVQITVADIPLLTNPTPGSTLTSSTVTFQWTAGSGVNSYWLGVGTSQASLVSNPWGDIFSQSTTSTSAIVSGIPINGNPVYVRLWWHVGSAWFFTDYTYQTN